ncbi:MAG: hypothetical protein COU10_01370 [Candidatus Harrisonbacteria bacterium CG10_big_fil_rev_8_21_14_0_10_45_28]|uniref:Uncharacterized protein n=1 Tax=Candidatus Harrisonbacteria bacterium CG10_big_fil_rev_8_21_14_0_10_45_28 TaxID=1974586 RepID=A0A2H0UNQ3_9BACT|nr:MAG: hypothetical protein COU10_01370 [Candidatus Harrisonbacteria bacterium CG10_big_fil_rev_8_21_14_0_10_45_28]
MDNPFGVSGDSTDNSKDVIYLARCDYRNQDRLFGIKRKDRRQHVYVIGKTGVGKSALLHNMITQDIQNGEGLAVVDPHGELVEGILSVIPKSRMDDVIYFNPADIDYHIGFNVMELPDPRYKHLVASGLMGIFTKIWANVWSARMEYILNNAILALLDTPGTTLLGIIRILVDKEYRQMIIANLQDPVVRAFWISEYEEWQDKFRNEAIAPIQNKVGQFLSTSIIRNVVGQTKSTIDIFELMNSGKIFLVNVSKGRIGEDNSALLGAMLITKIQLSSMERVRIPEEERKDFYLYVDEFQNFATDSFAGVLSEARKYRLNLIIAHQYIGQLVMDNSTKIRDAVFGNTGTMIVFRVGAADAEYLESEFAPEFEIEDVVNIPNYHIYLKLMVNGMTSRPFSACTLPPFTINNDAAGAGTIIDMSRKKYAKSREVVEAEINRWSSGQLGRDDDDSHSHITTKPGEAGKKLEKGDFFEVPCSVPGCGKIAKLPFKPDPNRPVYCSTCKEKLDAGEIQPPKILKKPSEDKMARASAELASMGIEFKMADVAPARNNSKNRDRNRSRDNKQNQPSHSSQPNQPPKEVSLSQLQNNVNLRQPNIKENKDTDKLKEALQNALDQNKKS